MTIRVAIVGAGGRMGQALLRAHAAVDQIKIVAGVLKLGHPLVGEDASRILGGAHLDIPLVSSLAELSNVPIDVIVDFSRPVLTLEVANWCQLKRVKLVSGTTGFTPEQRQTLQDIAQQTAIVHSNNMSPGVHHCFDLVATLAKKLGDQVDVEIVEAHHRFKVDAPSGTALRLGEIIADAWGVQLQDRAVFSREGHTGERQSGTIGFATIRAADIVGDHTVIFAAPGERIEITHKSSSREHYATGALMAARWVFDQRPGLYSMADVL